MISQHLSLFVVEVTILLVSIAPLIHGLFSSFLFANNASNVQHCDTAVGIGTLSACSTSSASFSSIITVSTNSSRINTTRKAF